jgi:hypothetical protein
MALSMLTSAAFFAWQCLSFARKSMAQLEDLIATITLVLIVLICLASAKYDAWYAGMFIPIAVISRAGSVAVPRRYRKLASAACSNWRSISIRPG